MKTKAPATRVLSLASASGSDKENYTMPFVTRKSLLTLSILSGVAVLAVAGFVWSGIYNIGADD